MKVQCSIISGHVAGGLQESSVKALNGNQLQPPILTRMGFCYKRINGMVGFMSGYYTTFLSDWPYAPVNDSKALPPPATPVESCTRQWSLYKTLDQAYSCTGLLWAFDDAYAGSTLVEVGGTYYTLPNLLTSFTVYAEGCTGISDMTVNCPISSGYPTQTQPIAGAGSNHQWGVVVGFTLWNVPAAYFSEDFSDSHFVNNFWDIYTGPADPTIHNAPFRSCRAKLINDFSNAVDLAGIYNSCYADFFGRAFSGTWATAFVNIFYKDCVASQGMDASTVSPATYDSSIQTSGPTGVTPGNLAGTFARCGWTITGSGAPAGGSLVIFRGQSTLDGSVTIPSNTPFWIGRCRLMAPSQPLWDATGNPISWPNTYPTRSISIFRQGLMNPGDVIAYESTGIFNLPFPATAPFPIGSYADSPLVADFYFAVIGQDPAGWAKQNGYVFDQTADNANLTADQTQTI